jgi:hypothetical protein
LVRGKKYSLKARGMVLLRAFWFRAKALGPFARPILPAARLQFSQETATTTALLGMIIAEPTTIGGFET